MSVNFLKAVAIQFNNTVYLNDGVTPGKTVNDVPTPGAGGIIDGDYWAVPVNTGVLSGFNYDSTEPDSTDAPDAQAFHVVRISEQNSANRWWLLGTSTDYANTSETVECCDDTSPVAVMPTDAPSIAPCQVVCEDAEGVFTAVVGLPTLAEGETYFPFGYFNGTALTAASGAGYANTTALLAFLNASWLTGALTNTWAVTEDDLTLTNTLDSATATGEDVLCVAVVAI